MIDLYNEKKGFIYDNIKRDNVQEKEDNIELDETLVNDLSFIEKKNEYEFFTYIDNIFQQGQKKTIIMENKEVINQKEIKNTLFRYYVLFKKEKTMIKIETKKDQNMEKDIENNFYLPSLIYDFLEEKKINNILNVHRIKNNFNFLKAEGIGFNVKFSQVEKYIKDFLE